MTVIHVTPSDSYTVIEAAAPGDEVVLAPGTYTNRLYLTAAGTASAPITIHAEDPSNPPVVDLGTTLVEDAPGSYGGGDKGRGCWQISGGTNYVIESIVFKHCRTSTFDSAGIRYYEGASITVRDCLFQDNDNGITGGTQKSTAVVEFCEFNHNGNAGASTGAPTHNMYIYGGTFTLRYSWVHDSLQGQNFHVRAQQSTLEYNWFARAASYEGDLMTDDDLSGGAAFTQSMIFRGNVIFEGTTQANSSQIIALYNDGQASGLTLSAHVLYNTFVGSDGHGDLVHLSNADGTTMTAEVDDNVIANAAAAVHVETASAATVSGTNNWMTTGSDTTGVTGTVFGANPGFAGVASEDFHLGSGSPAIGAASSSGIADLPAAEYWENETVIRMYRTRSTVKDIGAFESTTTGSPVGPYGTADGGTAGGDASTGNADGGSGSGGDGSTADSSVTPDGSEAAGDAGASNGASGGSHSGCGCELAERNGPASGLAALGALILTFAIRRRAER